jgi:hypothetical protein
MLGQPRIEAAGAMEINGTPIENYIKQIVKVERHLLGKLGGGVTA